MTFLSSKYPRDSLSMQNMYLQDDLPIMRGGEIVSTTVVFLAFVGFLERNKEQQ